MFQTLDEIVAEAEAEVARTAHTARRSMAEVEALLEREIAAGEPASSRMRTQSALRSLLKTQNLTPAEADLDLAWFDRTFPRGGWDPVRMPTLAQASYEDYRKRVRAAVERVLGTAQERRAVRAARDEWTALGAWLRTCPEYDGLGARRLIPILSTLTLGARLAGLRPDDMTDEALRGLHDAARDSSTRESYRNASALIACLQNDPERAAIWDWLPSPITPIRVAPRRSHELPPYILGEIEEMIEIAARLRYVAVKECWEYVADRTRDNYRNTLRALAGALATTGHLAPQESALRPILERPDALAAALREWLRWLRDGRWAPNTAIQYTGRLPCVFERNGLDVADLKRMLNDVDEFRDTSAQGEMNEATKAFCRALIERADFRSDFLLAHIPPRRAAEAILRRAHGKLRPSEATLVRQLGTVALFGAVECGGAPIRVGNFLEMTISGPDAWLKAMAKDRYELTVPAGRTKNKKRIWAPIVASREKYHDTVRWYLKWIRPLFLAGSGTGVAETSPYLVPAVTDPSRPLPYATFREWFLRIMRDRCGIVCTPHNFRHGQASILFHDNPGLLRTIARRLGDVERTVTETYAWVHEEFEAERGQDALVATIRGGRR